MGTSSRVLTATAARQDPGLDDWLAAAAARNTIVAERADLNELPGWYVDPDSGDIRHVSGRFFSVTGLSAERDQGPIPSWTQPIIQQPEVGILGLLTKRVDGDLHFLLQAKAEPGNCNGIQLSPTVQATYSNYTRVHGGKPVPYLEHFVGRSSGRVLVDVLQSEQGSWFYQKRNRNMIVEVTGEVEPSLDFRWVSLDDLYALLRQADMVNMDTRTVLACLPLHRLGGSLTPPGAADGRLTSLVRRSLDPGSPVSVGWANMLSWVTDNRCVDRIRARTVPLREVGPAWRRLPDRICHQSERFFSIVGVDVRATGREVQAWAQPMLRPHGTGLAAVLVTDVDGVLHLLVRIAPAVGYRESVELAPTVQCTPDNYVDVASRPGFLDELPTTATDRLLFDTVLSEEGGRFLHARTRYVVLEVRHADYRDVPDDYRWLTLAQLGDLLQHSHYVNVEARTLVAAVHSLAAGPGRD
ncbi:MAG: NDP-hexose 2,3-dehydratase family protein [Kineosporiaceae bacterium]